MELTEETLLKAFSDLKDAGLKPMKISDLKILVPIDKIDSFQIIPTWNKEPIKKPNY